MELKQIICEVNNELIKIFNLDRIDKIESYFNKTYIMRYETYFKQIVFEIYYDNYIINCRHKPMISVYKNIIGARENSSSTEYVDDSFYSKLNQWYKKFREHNLSIANNVLKNSVTYEKLEGINRMKGNKIYEFQEEQLIDLIDFKIFNYIRTGQILNSKNPNDTELIKSLLEIDRLYRRKEYLHKNSFHRSVQYYQLELMCKIEQNYKISKTFKYIKLKLNDKKEYLKYMSCFVAIRSGSDIVQNKFIFGIDDYLSEFIKKPEKIKDDIPLELFYLSSIKYDIRKKLEILIGDKILDNKNIEVNEYFKNFFGEGQHINRNKQWNEIKLRWFRDLYINN